MPGEAHCVGVALRNRVAQLITHTERGAVKTFVDMARGDRLLVRIKIREPIAQARAAAKSDNQRRPKLPKQDVGVCARIRNPEFGWLRSRFRTPRSALRICSLMAMNSISGVMIPARA